MIINKTGHKKLAFKLIAFFALAISIFGFIYHLIGVNFGIGNALTWNLKPVSLMECFYFSVVTITTLGYGDITPNGYARVVASIEAVFGLVYAGFSISQVVSFKQEALINYLTNDRIHQTFDTCLTGLVDAKEMIGDVRRTVQSKLPIDANLFFYYRKNPFYPALKAVQVLNGYLAHLEDIEKASEMSEKIEQAAHHVEEVAGFSRKLINIMADKNIAWNTKRTSMILNELCKVINQFSNSYIKYTRYKFQHYKGGGLYLATVSKTTSDIIGLAGGVHYRYALKHNKTRKNVPVLSNIHLRAFLIARRYHRLKKK